MIILLIQQALQRHMHLAHPPALYPRRKRLLFETIRGGAALDDLVVLPTHCCITHLLTTALSQPPAGIITNSCLTCVYAAICVVLGGVGMEHTDLVAGTEDFAGLHSYLWR